MSARSFCARSKASKWRFAGGKQPTQTTAELTAGAVTTSALLQRLDAEKAHSSQLAARVAELEDQVQKAHKFAATLNKQNDQLQREVIALESRTEDR